MAKHVIAGPPYPGTLSAARHTESRCRTWGSRLFRIASSLALAIQCTGAAAADFYLTGFGTVGYAVSDEDFAYLRYIDDKGTFKADSLVGVQAEVRLDPRFSATAQLVASAPRTRDDGYEVKLRWAFLSFRPDNDWLLRVGRLRPPVFFNTQNAEVGVTYDQARLPNEVYALSPVYDVDGLAVARTFSIAELETSVEAYWGKTRNKYRFHYLDEPPAHFVSERIIFKGLLLSLNWQQLAFRIGAHNADLSSSQDSLPQRFAATPVPAPAPIGGIVFVPVAPGNYFNATGFTMGAEWRPGPWRVTAEYGQRRLKSDLGPDDRGGYVSVAHQIGRWTPYATYARLISRSDTRAQFRQIDGVPVPLAAQLPPFSLRPDYHIRLAESISVYDQHSVMLGAAYAFSPTSKLKLEWMRTRVGLASSLVDADVHERSIHVLSVSYSVSF